ncbi:MAG: methyltransferase domain-containing protein [Elusimicrobiaceae bacterium]|nr:methyltransferase domain-containing protein [Elusimicrobiaceae bacterium]
MPQHADWKDPSLAVWYNKTLGFSDEQIKIYLAALSLRPHDTLVDFGCGNGVLLYHAAPLVKAALGVDSAAAQLALAREKNAAFGNVTFLERNFEDCRLDGHAFTRGSARKALHHLDEPAKNLFFRRAGACFEKNALFIIEDAVLDFELAELDGSLPRLESEAARYYGPLWKEIRRQFMLMMRTEYPASLSRWREAARAGGFEIVSHTQKTCFYGTLLMRKL